MKKLTTALFAAFAFCATAGDLATREWVLKQIEAVTGQHISRATVKEDVETDAVTGNVSTNYTITSAFSCPALPNCQSITLVVSPVSVASSTNATPPVSAVRSAKLKAPRMLFGDGTPGMPLSITLQSGYWTDEDGDLHRFTFEGLTITSSETLPDMPDTKHTCTEFDSNCNCVGCKNADDIEIPPEYESISEYDADAWFDIYSWIDPSTWGYQQTIGGKTYYFIEDDQGRLVNLDYLVQSDAWYDTVRTALKEANDWLRECRLSYLISQLCDQENPQHKWQTYSCGPYSWKVCGRNSSHKEGTERHDEHDTGRVPKQGYTGWTQRIYCTGGHKDVSYDHNCVHVECAPCTAGDSCNWPCPTCNGRHSFPLSAGSSKCARCSCDNCGVTERGAGREPDESLHTGWDSCHYKDDDDDRSNGAHCCCECGDFSHSHGSAHDRETLPNPTYEDCGDEDPHSHWRCDQTECKRCGDPFGVKEDHNFGDEPQYVFLSNEECAEKRICEDCGHEDVDEPGEAGEHSADGDPTGYTYVSDEICRRYYTCQKCEGEFYKDDEGHELSDEVKRYEYVSDEICRAYKECENCGYEIPDDANAHALPQEPTDYRDGGETCTAVYLCENCGEYETTEDGEHSYGAEPDAIVAAEGDVCREIYFCENCGHEHHEDGSHVRGYDCTCENGCGYEFDHDYTANACGIRKCSNCGKIEDPSTASEHRGWTSTAGGHTCACGEVTEGHTFVPGAVVQSSSGWTQTLTCSKCGFTKTFGHTHHFTNCGYCDAGDNCTVKCTGCNGNHVWGGVSSGKCAKCECTASDCNAHPEGDMSLHTGWAPCGEDAEEDNFDGSANGAHCACQCKAFGHNAGTGHDYQTPSGSPVSTEYDDENHLKWVGRCTRCGQNRKVKEGHTYSAHPYSYAIGDAVGGEEPPCIWLYQCKECGHVKREEHGHQYGAGEPEVTAIDGVLRITMLFTCENCGYIDRDYEERDCVHKEVILIGDNITFGDSLLRDCECSNCHMSWPHAFGSPENRNNNCPICRCQRENCSVTTNTVEGTHAFATYNGDELKSHTCICELVTEPCSMIETNGVFECITITKCAAPPLGCGHEFTELEKHTPKLVICGENVFCEHCGRKREGEEWVEAGEDQHSWGGKSQAERTTCVCDCGLVTAHYFAPDRATCGCECGGELSHIRGSDPTCKCTGDPSHTKVLIGHGALTTQTSSVTNRCSSCSKSWVDKVHTFTCTVCGDAAGSSIERGSHLCKGNWQQTAGTLTYSWEGYKYKQTNPNTGEEEEITVEGGSETSSWSGGGFSSAPPGKGAGAPAGSSVSASGATIWIDQSGTYRLRAKIDDGGSVEIGGLSASGPYYAWGAWVEGRLSEGPVSMSASADSVGGICGFDYELQFVRGD